MIALWGLLWVMTQSHAGKYASDHNLPGLSWRTIETERIHIHYPDSEKISAARTAREVAQVAEPILAQVEEAQGRHLNETVHIVVLDHDDGLSGFTIPQWDWVVISAHPGADLHRTRGRQTWIPDVLAHELSHLVSHKRAGAMAETVNYGLELGIYGEQGVGLAGATATLGEREPYWWAEGGAEYLSERAGYNWWSTARDANLRMTVLSGNLLGWRELQVRADKDAWNDAERVYQQGYAFARWIDATHGVGTFASIAEEARRGFGRWERAITEVLGEPGVEAWERFANEIRDHYVAQRSAVDAQGIVDGAELVLWTPPWLSPSLAVRDRFQEQRRHDRESAWRASGTWNLYGRYASDGEWVAEHRAGWIRVRPVQESIWPALSGEPLDAGRRAAELQQVDALEAWLPARFGTRFDFVPGAQALVLTAPMRTDRPAALGPELPYTWNQLFVVDLTPELARRRHRGGIEWFETLDLGSAGEIRRRFTPIPGSERGSDPSVSPSGERVAYLHYGDGTTNLVVSRLDGTERELLSDFDDGTWLSGPDWSPDGTKIVVAMSRNYQQNLWIVDVETSAWRAITDDGWEELDPYWADDGIYFGADPTGIFDIYRWSEDGEVRQITRVVGGASTPSITPEGHLLFTLYTGSGYKTHGLRRDLFLEEDASEHFGAVESQDLSWRPSMPEPTTRRYSPLRSIATPSLGPVARLDFAADGATPRGGAYLKIRDYVEDHDLSAFGLTGRDTVLEGAYTYRGLRPDLRLWGSWQVDDRPLVVLEPELQKVWDRRAVSSYGLTLSYPYSKHLSFAAHVSRVGLRYAPRADQTPSPLLDSVRGGVGVEIGDAEVPRRVDEDWHWLQVGYVRGQSVLPEPQRDDGELLDRYGYDQVRSALRLALPVAGGALERHRLELGWDAVFTNANLFREEEARAGGDHPYALRLATLGPTAPMPGYGPYSLRGEELLIGHAAWRFPIIRRFPVRRGRGGRAPFLEQIWGRLGTDIGNVWGYDRSLDHGNPLLGDLSVELRVAASLFDAPWDSSIGLAQGFQDVTYPRADSEPVAEPMGADGSGLRVYVNIGGGW